MEYKDYYKILGVEREASEDEIKRTYRQLALKYHPDRNPGDSSAEEKFKEINEAYQVLSDPEKRAHYNQLGEAYNRYARTGGTPGGFNWGDWTVGGAPGGAPGGVRVEQVDLDDLLGGSFSDFFRQIFGGAGAGRYTAGGYRDPFGGMRNAQQPVSRDLEQPVTISLQEAYHGTKRLIQLDGRRLEVTIPRGARSGTRVRVSGALPEDANGRSGDLYLVVNVSDMPGFERRGDDLATEQTVDLYTAVLGGEVHVPTLTGSVVLTVPPGTQPGQKFRLSGQGMPVIKNPKKHGNLYVNLQVEIPANLSKRERELFQELAKIKRSSS